MLTVHGDLTAATAARLRTAGLEAARAHDGETSAIIVDLSQAGHVDANGTDALRTVHTATSDEGLSMHVVALDPGLEALRDAGLHRVFTVHPTVADAVAEATGADETELLREALIQRRRQLRSMPVIEQAKGMLMQDFGLTDDAAFALLTRLSHDTNTKVHDIAVEMVETLSGMASPTTSQATLHTIEALRDRLRDQP